MKRVIAVIAFVVMGALLAQAAQAEQGQGRGQGKGQRGEGKGQRRPPVVFGTIISISGNTWTIKPQLPPHIRERRAEKGKEMPQLPESLTVTVSETTKYFFEGQASSAGAFKSGAEVVIKLDKPARQGGSVAQIVADPETAREFILKKMRARGGPGGEGRQRDDDQGQGGQSGGGQRGEGRKGPRPMFGTITAVSGSSLTIKPEVPEFVSELMPNRGEKLTGKLPESITVKLDGETRFIVGEQEQNSNPFATGDKVAIMGAGPKGEVTARAVSDYASAKQRMQQRKENRQNKQGAR